MFKFIFYSQNLNLVKKLYNNVLGNFNNLQLIGIASNESELQTIFKNSGANMIIIISKDINNDKIKKLLENFKVKIIFTNSNSNMNSNKFTLYIPDNIKNTELKSKLTRFLSKIDEKLIYKKVYNLLESYNFNFKLHGTIYLLYSIVYLYINNDDNIVNNLEKNVYPYVAEKFKVSTSCVKWSIVRAINNYYNTNNIEKINKPTPKILITEFLCKLY